MSLSSEFAEEEVNIIPASDTKDHRDCMQKISRKFSSSEVTVDGGVNMSYKPIAPAPTGSNHTPPGSCGSSPSLASSSNFRPAFSDFGPPSMGFVQPVKVSQGSTYSELLSVIEEMSREIRPTYAGSKSAMERLKRGIIHARALVRECLAETERSART